MQKRSGIFRKSGRFAKRNGSVSEKSLHRLQGSISSGYVTAVKERNLHRTGSIFQAVRQRRCWNMRSAWKCRFRAGKRLRERDAAVFLEVTSENTIHAGTAAFTATQMRTRSLYKRR